MTRALLVRRGLTQYWRTHVAVVLGVGVAVAVLAGALLVGESVRASLRQLAEERQGRADVLVTGATYVREALAGEVAAAPGFAERFESVVPLIVTSATAEATASGARAAGVTVYGVDDRFWQFHGLDVETIGVAGREAWLSPALASELGTNPDDGLVLAIEQPSSIPRGLLQGRRDAETRSVRLVVKGTLDRGRLGEFSLRPQQGAVRAIFAPLSRLQADLQRRESVNTLLFSLAQPAGRSSNPVAAVERPRSIEALTTASPGTTAPSTPNTPTNATTTAVTGTTGSAAGSAAGSATGNTVGNTDRAIDTTTVAPDVDRTREAASDAGAVTQLLRSQATFADLGVTFRDAASDGAMVIESQAGLMSDRLVQVVDAAGVEAGVHGRPVLTYLATSIAGGRGNVPYSTVAAVSDDLLPRVPTDAAVAPSTRSDANAAPTGGSASAAAQPQQTPPIWLNDWAARDLAIAPGEPVTLDYFIWNDDDGLESRSARFHFAGVLDGPHGLDPTLTPDYPGLTDQTRMADWDPPFPVDLTRVRRVDEDYWAAHRAAPKAFVRLEDGQRLWLSKYGGRSSTRFHAVPPTDVTAGRGTTESTGQRIQAALRGRLASLVEAQFVVVPLRDERTRAAQGTTDFGEYFVYFSFFLVVSALLLAALFYRFGVEQRVREVGLLTAVGFTRAQVVRTLGAEGLVLAVAGTILGLLGAWGFAALVVLGLRTWWVDAVGTTALEVHVSATPLVAGALGGLLASTGALVAAVIALTKQSARSLLAGVVASDPGRSGSKAATQRARGARRRAMVALLAAAMALTLMGLSQSGVLDAVGGFFGAGLLLLVAGLTALSWWLRRPAGSSLAPGPFALLALGARALTHRPGRTTLSVALIAFAMFVIVSVTAFRKDTGDTSHERASGTGGYGLIVETAVPLMHDPGTPEGRSALTITDAADGAFARATTGRLRLRPGDDASCLNLYRPTRPRILGVPADFAGQGRFRFGSTLAETDAEREAPWRLLERTFPDGAIPAIVDANSLTYVFHLGVGDDIVLPPEQGAQTRLRVVGTLVDSIFQSEVLIGDAAFRRAFPQLEGHSLFLFELDAADDRVAAERAIERQWGDYGADAIDAGVRLASFHRVENTYLATFQTLGALGLVLGVFGLALIVARNILERQRELGLLRAVGFEPRHMATLVVSETAAMLMAGLLTGTTAALVAIVPALVARSQALPVGWLVAMVATVLVAGVVAAVSAVTLLQRLPLLRALRSE